MIYKIAYCTYCLYLCRIIIGTCLQIGTREYLLILNERWKIFVALAAGVGGASEVGRVQEWGVGGVTEPPPHHELPWQTVAAISSSAKPKTGTATAISTQFSLKMSAQMTTIAELTTSIMSCHPFPGISTNSIQIC